MNIKIVCFLVCMLLIGSSCVVFQTFDFVKAETGMEYDSINLDYIREITQNLSDKYFNAFGEDDIKKGRQYGTKGEISSLNTLTKRMEIELSLDGGGSDGAYFEENDGDYICKTDDKLKITDKTITVNFAGGGSQDIEGYVSPFVDCAFTRTIKYRMSNDLELEHLNPIPSGIDIDDSPVYKVKDRKFTNLLLRTVYWGVLIFRNNFVKVINFVRNWIKIEHNFDILNFEEFDEVPDFFKDEFEDLPRSTGYFFIMENPNFNTHVDPSPQYYKLPPYHHWGPIITTTVQMFRRWFYSQSCIGCKGVILYDNPEDNSDVYDMNVDWIFNIPSIYIKGSDYTTHFSEVEVLQPRKSVNTISVETTQVANSNIDTYNVIGQIEGEDNSSYVILSSLYDSWWNQGTADSAIGMGIVMGIAQYMKHLEENLSIIPKNTIKFIGFGAEEAGFYGAYDYEARHPNNNLTAILDINQVAFIQDEPQLDMLIFTNDHNDPMDPYPLDDELVSLAKIISDDTDYKRRTGVNFTTICPRNDLTQKSHPVGAPSNDKPFASKRDYPDCKTFCFAKDKGENPENRWILHHRANEAGDKGDTMDYYDDEEVEVCAELIWNFTKYFTIDPDSELVGEVTFATSDSPNDDDSDIDTITASFTLDTIMPHDKVRVEAKLLKPGPVVVCTEITDFIITDDGTSGEISVTLSPNFNAANYMLSVNLYNSTQRINETVYGNGLTDDYASSNWTYLNPRGNEPAEVSSGPSGDTTVKIGTLHSYSSSASDANGDNVFFQYSWQHPDQDYWEIIDEPHSPDIEWCVTHAWWKLGNHKVRVRVCDEYDYNEDNPINSAWSEWSYPPLDVTVKIFTNVYTNPSPMPYNTQETIYMAAEEETQLYSLVLGGSGNVDYTWNFGDQSDPAQEANPEHTYNNAGNYTINLSVNDGLGNTSYILKNVNVTDKAIDFNMSTPICTYPNEIVYFNDTSLGGEQSDNLTWFFDVGNLSFYNMTNTTYGDFVNHTFLNRGSYDVNLTILDKQDNVFKITKTINVDYDIDHPIISDTTHTPNRVLYDGSAVVFSRIQDETSSIKSAWLNVIRPNTEEVNVSFDYITNDTFYTFFNNTDRTGEYRCRVGALDYFDNLNYSDEFTIKVDTLLGNTDIGDKNQSMTDRCGGLNFTMPEYGTVNSITAYIYSPYAAPLKKSKCKIFRTNDTVCIGTSEEKSFNNSIEGGWMTYNFSDPMPYLEPDVEYVLSIWSDGVYLFYEDVEDERGRHYNKTYNTSSWPSPIPWVNETRLYSIYCNYSKEKYPPEIFNVSDSPDMVGFGYNVSIETDVTDNISGVYEVKVNVTYPDETIDSFTMEGKIMNHYEYVFSDTWLIGRYNYTIWAVDDYGNQNMSINHSFNVSANATISVCTMKNIYVTNESLNITDPPVGSPLIGYELLDDDSVLHIWNRCDSYYFDTESGIQLTNHKDEYWSHNVLMIGYYNINQWNLMYRTDELSGFAKDIDTDDETYINITLWKDLSYGGYDFRLAIRYYLGVDDNELTVTPYIKNIDTEDIPYILGFGWEMKDIQIDMTETGDYIQVGNDSYYLNQTLDNSYTNLSDPIYDWDETTEEYVVVGYTDPVFYLMEDISEDVQKSLYLRWDKDLTYKLQVESRDGQYNAPATLFVRIGTLDIGQEKYTDMFWYDAGQVTYYFDRYDENEAWAIKPSSMVDGDTEQYAASSTTNDVELCNRNTYSSPPGGTISKVELRAYGYTPGGYETGIYIRPVFDGTSDGDNHYYSLPAEVGAWSSWYDITDDTNATSTWSWDNISNLDCDIVKAPSDTACVSKIEIRVTYNNDPAISNPNPTDNSINISMSPTLSINVTDGDGELMNITWYSNSSGSWAAFGTNTSVSNGTYSQIFSNASVNGQWWYWKVNVSDGYSYTESNIYKFYTGIQSKIVNTGSTNISGYLLMQVEYYNESLDWWFIDNGTIDDTTPRTINISEQIGLDLIFNGLLNISDLTHGDGTYRIYAAFRNPYGVPLVCDDETVLEAYWEFEVDTI